MPDKIDVFATITGLGMNEKSGVYLNQGCNDSDIQQMQSLARKELGEEIPPGFIRLLRLTNGIQINGACFKEAENLIPENLDYNRCDVIILGNEGNMAEFVFHRVDRQFHIINMGFPDERFKSYTTFEDMLLDVLKEQQVLK